MYSSHPFFKKKKAVASIFRWIAHTTVVMPFGLFGGGKKKKLEKLLVHVEQTVDPSALWKEVGELGEGSFGIVKKVKNIHTGQVAAAKVIPIETEDDLTDYIVEVDIMAELPHENVVGLVGAYMWKDNLWIVMELCDGGALDDALIELERGLEEQQIRGVAKQLLYALAHLHANHVIHRDLKAGNLLLTHEGKIKLTDFGVSAYMKSSKKKRDTFIGTPYWMAPEVIICENIRDRPYDVSADVWSFGITLLELAETAPPYQDMHPMRVLFRIPKSAPPTLAEPHLWSREFTDFLAECLRKDPVSRPSIADLLDHPFVRDVDAYAPCRDLFRLIKADVVETIKALDHEDQRKFAETQIDAMTSIADAEKKPVPFRKAPAPPAVAVSVVEEDEEEKGDLDRTAFGFDDVNEKTEKEKQEEEKQKPKKNLLKLPDADDDDKKFKTLTKTRKFVNEEGKEIVYTTQRVIETAKPDGFTATLIKSRGSNIPSHYHDWEQSETQRLALLRKQQLRDMQLLRRAESKETGELVAKLRDERDTNAQRQEKEMDEVQKQYEKVIVIQDKHANSLLDAMEKEQANALANKHKVLQKELAKQLKLFKKESLVAIKRVKQRSKSLPKSERKEGELQAMSEAQSKADEQENVLQQRHSQREQRDLTMLRAEQRAELLRTKLSLMSNEHDVLKSRSKEIADLGTNHLLEKHQMLRHQLHATFLLQKHQIHYRHEKQLMQLDLFHHKKVEDLDARFKKDLKILPKKHKAERAQRKKELKRDLSKDKGALPTQALDAFKSEEDKKFNVLLARLEDAYKSARQTLLHQREVELQELREEQQSKKQSIITNETLKLRQLDMKHAQELKDYKQQLKASNEKLEEECLLEQRRIESNSGSTPLLENNPFNGDDVDE
eukprot:m.50484 g.50484  ORF g.50484 m.50484 type:complete len:896 (-) comp7515_c0_seq1:271-2958(-)